MRVLWLMITTVLLVPAGFAGDGEGAVMSALAELWPEAVVADTVALSDSLAGEAQLRLPGTPNDTPVHVLLLQERTGGAVGLENTGNEVDEASPDGYAITRQAMGRYEPFRFLLVLDGDRAIRGIRVLEYHSPYGGEIAQPSWLDQFRGLFDPERVTVGAGVDAISGATYSVHGLTEEVRYTLQALHWLHDIGELP